MQRLGDKAELLLEIDDIVVTLTVDIHMGFKRKKLSNVELADMDEDTRVPHQGDPGWSQEQSRFRRGGTPASPPPVDKGGHTEHE